MTPEQRDIVLVPVPFTDLSTTKRRPVLVLSGTAHNQQSPDVIVAAITSNTAAPAIGTDISNADLEIGSLRRDSRVLSGKVYTLSKAILERVLGRLEPTAFGAVLAQLDGILARQAEQALDTATDPKA